MPVQELDLRASMLRTTLASIKSAPDDKSINQVKEEAIIHQFEEVAKQAEYAALHERIYAVGKTPEACVEAVGKANNWEITSITLMEGGDDEYTWGRRFYADGTSMKCAGWEVPGGFIMTWML